MTFTPPDFRFFVAPARVGIHHWADPNASQINALLTGKVEHQDDLCVAWHAMDDSEKLLFSQLLWRKNPNCQRPVETLEWGMRQRTPEYPDYPSDNLKLLAKAYGLALTAPTPTPERGIRWQR